MSPARIGQNARRCQRYLHFIKWARLTSAFLPVNSTWHVECPAIARIPCCADTIRIHNSCFIVMFCYPGTDVRLSAEVIGRGSTVFDPNRFKMVQGQPRGWLQRPLSGWRAARAAAI